MHEFMAQKLCINEDLKRDVGYNDIEAQEEKYFSKMKQVREKEGTWQSGKRFLRVRSRQEATG